MFRRSSTAFALFLSLMLAPSIARANTVVLTFDELPDAQPVGNFYNGGGNKFIPNLGITFSSNVYGLQSELLGGAGAFTPTVTSTPAIFVMGATGSNATGFMNVAHGFSAGVNFFYTSAFQETVTVWSGQSGTGTVLATINLAANDGSCAPVAYCNWTNVGLSFSGTAQSITFSGPANGMGISDIALGQTNSLLPEPSSLFLLGTGLVFVSIPGIRRLMRS